MRLLWMAWVQHIVRVVFSYYWICIAHFSQPIVRSIVLHTKMRLNKRTTQKKKFFVVAVCIWWTQEKKEKVIMFSIVRNCLHFCSVRESQKVCCRTKTLSSVFFSSCFVFFVLLFLTSNQKFRATVRCMGRPHRWRRQHYWMKVQQENTSYAQLDTQFARHLTFDGTCAHMWCAR